MSVKTFRYRYNLFYHSESGGTSVEVFVMKMEQQPLDKVRL